MKADLLFAMGLTFFTTAIFSVGGISAMIPEIHRQVVEVHGWLGNDSFASAFALSQIAPGPNILLMTILGWRIAGWSGLAVATLATIIPTSALSLVAGRAENRISHARWYSLMKRSFPPLVVGLICASALVTAQAAIDRWFGYVLMLGVALFVAFSRKNPLVPLSVATLAGIIAGRLGYF
jgi:chromate transporter